MSITTTILLAAASMFPALIASVGRCYREKDLFSFACCELPTANLIQKNRAIDTTSFVCFGWRWKE
ncbi:MAG TPA: hypothetical protein DCG33_08345 [Prevotellaceae bacterium]|nr:hypothetical protein [Prevotellaceae bacterium]